MLERIAVHRERQRESAALINASVVSVKVDKLGATPDIAPGVDVPEMLGDDGQVCGREVEKSVMCVRV
jgi:hypothetical protein